MANFPEDGMSSMLINKSEQRNWFKIDILKPIIVVFIKI